MRKWIGICLLLSAACAPVAGTQIPAAGGLLPYETMTPVSNDAAAIPPTALTQAAQPSPTPFTYTIKQGDTLGQIAEQFNVDLDALQALNPDVNPNGMRVGETLKIPSGQKAVEGVSTPTPASFSLQPIICYSTADKGLWCFAAAQNNSSSALENVTAQVTLLDGQGQQVGSQTALLPLDILPPGQSLPLSAYFPPGIPSDLHPEIQILTAIRLAPEDPRYLSAHIQNTVVEVDASGRSAQASGAVVLSSASKPASRIWVAAAAYDADGKVTGVRRWESAGDLSFSFLISSMGGPIDHVDFSVEARP